MKRQDYFDNLILGRHEVIPSGNDLSKIAFKEGYFGDGVEEKRGSEISSIGGERSKKKRKISKKKCEL